MHQIRYLAHSCSELKKRIYSPLGWKIISRLKTPYPIQVVFVKSELKEKMRKVGVEGGIEGLDEMDDEKYIAKQRAKYKTMLLSKYTNYLKSKQKYEACHDKVRTQRAHLLRIKQQINYLQVVRQQLDQQNKQNKQKLKLLSEGFSAKIRDMDELNDSISKERTKLQSQKEALAAKIRDYQHQIQMIKEDSEKSKQILRRLKNYLLYKQL